jgi:hypothetical protein
MLLIHAQLLANLRTRCTCQQTLEFDVDLFFLLNLHVFFNHLFGFLDQPFLQSLDLLQQFPSFGVSAFKFAPPVVIQRILELLRKSLDLKFLSHQLRLQSKTLFAQITNLGCLALDNLKFTLQIADAELEEFDVFKTLLVLQFSLRKRSLENLDLFVQECKFVVSADELSAKNVAFVDSLLHFFLGQFVFLCRVFDDVV